jgi:hypothetical protein
MSATKKNRIKGAVATLIAVIAISGQGAYSPNRQRPANRPVPAATA